MAAVEAVAAAESHAAGESLGLVPGGATSHPGPAPDGGLHVHGKGAEDPSSEESASEGDAPGLPSSPSIPYRCIGFLSGWAYSLADVLGSKIQQATQAVDPNNLSVFLSVGRLVGADTRKPIRLPVVGPVLLDPTAQEECEYVDSVPHDFFERFLAQYVAGGMQAGWALTVQDRRPPDQVQQAASPAGEVVYHFRDASGSGAGKLLVRDVLGADGSHRRALSRVTVLDDWVIYRPLGDLHARVVCATARPLDEAAALRVLETASLEKVESVEKTVCELKPAEGSRGALAALGTVVRSWVVLCTKAQQLETPKGAWVGRDPDAPAAAATAVAAGAGAATAAAASLPTVAMSREALLAPAEEEHSVSARLLLDWGAVARAGAPAAAVRELLVHAECLARAAGDGGAGGAAAVASAGAGGVSVGAAAVAPDEAGKFYFPTFFGDVASLARQHYNRKQARGLVAATRSPIGALRKLNNLVKRTLIELFCPRQAAVLDLACGHGQDLYKYTDVGARRFVGIDISDVEIAEARHRLLRGKAASRSGWEFYVGNILSERGYPAPLLAERESFDVVSIQLAIHYCLASETQARFLMRKIAQFLKVGGVFMGSTNSVDTFAGRLAANNRLAAQFRATEEGVEPDGAAPPAALAAVSFGNDVYRVTVRNAALTKMVGAAPSVHYNEEEGGYTLFSGGDAAAERGMHEVRWRLRNQWGHIYSFWLLEHIDAEEYIVPWAAFVRLAQEFDLELATCATFHEFFKEQCRVNPALPAWVEEQFKHTHFDAAQAEAFSFYQVFAFRKTAKGEAKLLLPPEEGEFEALAAPPPPAAPAGAPEFAAATAAAAAAAAAAVHPGPPQYAAGPMFVPAAGAAAGAGGASVSLPATAATGSAAPAFAPAVFVPGGAAFVPPPLVPATVAAGPGALPPVPAHPGLFPGFAAHAGFPAPTFAVPGGFPAPAFFAALAQNAAVAAAGLPGMPQFAPQQQQPPPAPPAPQAAPSATPSAAPSAAPLASAAASAGAAPAPPTLPRPAAPAAPMDDDGAASDSADSADSSASSSSTSSSKTVSSSSSSSSSASSAST